MRALPLLACLPFLISPAAANARQTPPAPAGQANTAPESYRIRIANTLYGAVEASVDKGTTWMLIARVAKPAVDRVPGAPEAAATVQKGSGPGVVLGVGGGKLIRLVPDSPAAQKDPAAIVVNLPAPDPLFKDLLPAGTPVQEQIAKRAVPLPAEYFPQDEDHLLFIVAPPSALKLPDAFRDAQKAHHESCLARLKAANRKPTSGYLTLTVNLAKGEKPDAVTYYLDGAVLAIQNRAPFTLRIDTHRWPNGEHLVEVRALDPGGATLTSKKALIFVDNSALTAG